MVDIFQLGLEVRSDGVVVASDRLKQLSKSGEEAEKSAGGLSAVFDKLGYSLQNLQALMMKAASALALLKLAELAKDAMLLSARYETLGVVMTVIGKNAGKTQSEMAGFQQALQKTGISAIEARQGLALMGQAQIDFANSGKLARIAQDAAVVGNINSSEAFNRMITGLATGQSIMLHHLGLMTNFESAYVKAAAAAGKTTKDLTETEKSTIRMNEVIRAGVGIAGSYEAAMGTAGKQLNSMKRYWSDLMVQVGSSMQGPLLEGVTGITAALKFLSSHFEEVKLAAMAALSVLAGIAVFMASSFAPVVIIGVADAIGVVMMALINVAYALVTADAAALSTATSFKALSVAMAGNWVGLIIAALTIAVGWWITYKKAQDDAMKLANKDDDVLVNMREKCSLLREKLRLLKENAAFEGMSNAEVLRMGTLERKAAFLQKEDAQGGFRASGALLELQEMRTLYLGNLDLEKQVAAATPKEKPKSPTTTTETDFNRIKSADDSRRALNESYWAWEDAGYKAQAKTAVDALIWQHDQGIVDTQRFISEKETLEKGAIQKEILRNQSRTAEIAGSTSIKDGPGSYYSEQTLKYNAAQKQLNESLTKGIELKAKMDGITATAGIDRDKDRQQKSDQYLSAEQRLLVAQGEAYAAAEKQIEIDQRGRIQMDAMTKATLAKVDAITLEKIAYDQALASKNAVQAAENANSTFSAAQVGKNAAGGFDSVTDQIKNQMAVRSEAHVQAMKQIEDERLALIRKAKVSSQDPSVQAGITAELAANAKKLTNEEIDHSQKKTAIAEQGFKSQLAGAAQYTGMAGQLFTELASTQDQSSRSGFESAKAFSLAAAVMNTAAAIMNAMATVPYPMNIAAAAIAGVMGAVQIAKIASTSFGGGGSAPAAPGSFSMSGGGGTSGASNGIGNMAQPTASVYDRQTQESLHALVVATNNSTMAIGKLAKSTDDLATLFKTGGMGMALATNAPGIGATVTASSTFIGSVWTEAKGVLQAMAGNIVGGFTNVFNAMMGGATHTTGAGISLGVTNGQIGVRDYQDTKTDGGFFGLFGGSSGTNYQSDKAATDLMQGLIQPFMNDITRMAQTLGTTVDAKNFQLPESKISTAGKTPEAISKELDAWSQTLLENMSLLVVGLKDNVGTYDNAYTMLKKYNDALVSTNDSFELIGYTTLQGSLANGKLAVSLQTLMGGTEKFTEGVNTYFKSMFTDQEQASNTAAQASSRVTRAFAAMNSAFNDDKTIATPVTKEDFRALVDNLNMGVSTNPDGSKNLIKPVVGESSDRSQALFAALMGVSEDFATMIDYQVKQAKTLLDANQALDVRQMKATGHSQGADLMQFDINAAAERAQAVTDNLGAAYIERLGRVLDEERLLVGKTALDTVAEAAFHATIATRTMALTATTNEMEVENLRIAQLSELTDAQNKQYQTADLVIVQAGEMAAVLKRQADATTATAAALAKSILDSSNDLSVRTLTAQGDTETATLMALRIKQTTEMNDYQVKGLDTTRLAIVHQLEWTKAIIGTTEATKAAAAETQRQASITGQISIIDALNGIKGTDTSLTPAQKLSAAKDLYEANRNASYGGDTTAMGDVGGNAKSYLDAAAAYYGTAGGQYRDIYASVTGELSSLVNGQPQTVSELQALKLALIDSKTATVGLNSTMTAMAAVDKIKQLGELGRIQIASDTYTSAGRLDLAATADRYLGVQRTIALAMGLSPSLVNADNRALWDGYTGATAGHANMWDPSKTGQQSYAVGSTYIPNDMYANIHQGEMILDRRSADVLRNYGIQVSGSADNRDNEEQKATTEEIRTLIRLQSAANQAIIDRLDAAESHLYSIKNDTKLAA